ncbi:hypothetical protein Glove_561g4 [Diversispora epigaea]|uniref:Uncharacterized protein n=1 Tax=Diversispora epigaea TaxID=1348612 RepID=A0A397GAU0_9GLOM|nr:hypothetical protein Glove_561g4 [Diversispora epigaea]
MNNIPIPDSLRKRVHKLQREFPQILGEAQVIIDNTGAYLVTESTVIEIDQPVNNEIITQYDNMLMIYTVDIFTALEKQDRVINLDLDELLRIATDMHGTNGQRMNAYKKLGDYLQHQSFGNSLGSQELPFEGGNLCGEYTHQELIMVDILEETKAKRVTENRRLAINELMKRTRNMY